MGTDLQRGPREIAQLTPVRGYCDDYEGLSAGAVDAALVPAFDVSGYCGFSLQVGGIFTGELSFEASNDATLFFPLAVAPLAGGVKITTTAAPGIFVGYLPCQYFRVVMTAFTSGVATGALRLLTLPPALTFFVDSTPTPDPPPPPPHPYVLGETYGGGIVFYLLLEGDPGYDADVQHGLIALATDWSEGAVSTVSYTDNLDPGIPFGTSPVLGSGAANSALIATSSSGMPNLGSTCAAMSYGGYTDWYCGSFAEMNLWVASEFTVCSMVIYWSSSECDSGVDDPAYYGRALDVATGTWLPAEQLNFVHHLCPFRSF